MEKGRKEGRKEGKSIVVDEAISNLINGTRKRCCEISERMMYSRVVLLAQAREEIVILQWVVLSSLVVSLAVEGRGKPCNELKKNRL